MSEPIEPALSKVEWIGDDDTPHMDRERPGHMVCEVLIGEGGDLVLRADSGVVVMVLPQDRPAVAALALHGQPFGFNRDDVEHLRLVAGQADALRLGANHATTLRGLADRIAALLPPRE